MELTFHSRLIPISVMVHYTLTHAKPSWCLNSEEPPVEYCVHVTYTSLEVYKVKLAPRASSRSKKKILGAKGRIFPCHDGTYTVMENFTITEGYSIG